MSINITARLRNRAPSVSHRYRIVVGAPPNRKPLVPATHLRQIRQRFGEAAKAIETVDRSCEHDNPPNRANFCLGMNEGRPVDRGGAARELKDARCAAVPRSGSQAACHIDLEACNVRGHLGNTKETSFVQVAK